jgi:hypothetical protein
LQPLLQRPDNGNDEEGERQWRKDFGAVVDRHQEQHGGSDSSRNPRYAIGLHSGASKAEVSNNASSRIDQFRCRICRNAPTRRNAAGFSGLLCKPLDIDQNETSPDPSPITAISEMIGPAIAVMTISR